MDFNEKTFVKETNKYNKISNIKYIYFDYIDISLGDPISAITLTNKYVIIGTMTGGIKLYYFNERRIYIISKNNIEYISGLYFSNQDHILFAGVGDIHYLKYEMKEPFMDNSMPFSKINIYETTMQHNFSCENAFVLMSSNSILKLSISDADAQENISDDVYINYDITFLKKSFNSKTRQNIESKLKTTNFIVPLDYDGANFCWVEYKNQKQDRDICIHNIVSDHMLSKVDNRFPVNKSYGHISHAKLLKDHKLLIVHNLNKCDIYNVENEQFELISQFTHIGDEVYSVDIVYGFNMLSKSYNINNEPINQNLYLYDDFTTSNKIKVSENQRLKIRDKNLKNSSSDNKIDSINFYKYNFYKNKNVENDLSCTIITLDIDGNVNKYENSKEEKLFNLYEINGIYQDFKDKKFFNMGYMYFIKTNLDYFCITTDHGCFIIKKIET